MLLKNATQDGNGLEDSNFASAIKSKNKTFLLNHSAFLNVKLISIKEQLNKTIFINFTLREPSDLEKNYFLWLITKQSI